jgi:GTPase SAR1 family protein
MHADTTGADEYLHLRDGWIRANEGFILVYSISSRLSFTRIQGLYDQIQQIKKSPHPHTSFPVPIMLVGNKVDSAKRRVSLLESEVMARKLGCRFVEALARNGRNVEESFYTIVKQLQKQSATTGIEELDDLVDSLPEWDTLLNHLEGEISRSAIANTRPLVPALPPKENVGLLLWQRFTTLHSSQPQTLYQPASTSSTIPRPWMCLPPP